MTPAWLPMENGCGRGNAAFLYYPQLFAFFKQAYILITILNKKIY